MTEEKKEDSLASDSLVEGPPVKKIKIDKVNLENSSSAVMRMFSSKRERKQTPKVSKKSSSKKVFPAKPAITEEEQSVLYTRPFGCGWKREIVKRNVLVNANHQSDVYYKTPDGKKLRSTPMVVDYLKHNSTELTIDCFTFAKKRVYKEPEETERNALPIRSSIGTPSPQKKKPLSARRSLTAQRNKAASKKEEVVKEENVKQEDVKEEELKTKDTKKEKKKEKVEKTKVPRESKKVLKSEKDVEGKRGSRGGRMSVVKRALMDIKSIDEDIEQLKSLSSTSQAARTLLPHTSPAKGSKRKRSKKKVTKEEGTVSSPGTIDYMSQVDQLVASDLSYEDKVVAVRNLAKHSLHGLFKQDPPKPAKEESKNVAVQEVGKVFDEGALYAGSECSLFTDEEEAVEGGQKDGKKEGVDEKKKEEVKEKNEEKADGLEEKKMNEKKKEADGKKEEVEVKKEEAIVVKKEVKRDEEIKNEEKEGGENLKDEKEGTKVSSGRKKRKLEEEEEGEKESNKQEATKKQKKEDARLTASNNKKKTPSHHPTTKTPSNHPTTKTPSNHSTTKTPSHHPTTKTPSNHPTTKTPSDHSTTKTPSNHPTTKTSSNHPTTKTSKSKVVTKKFSSNSTQASNGSSTADNIRRLSGAKVAGEKHADLLDKKTLVHETSEKQTAEAAADTPSEAPTSNNNIQQVNSDNTQQVNSNNTQQVNNNTQQVDNNNTQQVNINNSGSHLDVEDAANINNNNQVNNTNNKVNATNNNKVSTTNNSKVNKTNNNKDSGTKNDSKTGKHGSKTGKGVKKAEQENFQMLVISPVIKSHLNLARVFTLKVEGQCMLIKPSQVFCGVNRVTLKLPNNSLPPAYSLNHKLPLKFSVEKTEDGAETLNVRMNVARNKSS